MWLNNNKKCGIKLKNDERSIRINKRTIKDWSSKDGMIFNAEEDYLE